MSECVYVCVCVCAGADPRGEMQGQFPPFPLKSVNGSWTTPFFNPCMRTLHIATSLVAEVLHWSMHLYAISITSVKIAVGWHCGMLPWSMVATKGTSQMLTILRAFSQPIFGDRRCPLQLLEGKENCIVPPGVAVLEHFHTEHNYYKH